MPQPRKLILDQRQCPGDVTVLTAAVKALHQSHPGAFVTDYHGFHGPERPTLITGATNQNGNNLFANNPFITPLEPYDGQHIECCYGYACNNASRPFHFLYGFVEFLQNKLGVPIELKDFRGDIYLSAEERVPWPDLPDRYWLIDAGCKADVTCKQWSYDRYQKVVDAFAGRIQFVQTGSAHDKHPALSGVINLVGKTNLRELIRVMHRAAGVLTPVSFPMHLAQAVPTVEMIAPDGGCNSSFGSSRGCVVIAGHREQPHWERYPGHQYLGASGRIGCTTLGGGCWKNKIFKVDRDMSLCLLPAKDEVGQDIPECLRRISVDEVVRAIESFETL